MTPDPNSSFGFLLHDVARLLRRNINRRAHSMGLTQAQRQTLAHLSRNQGINQAALADIMEMQPISLARILDRLQECGLVERRPDPADRRAFRLYLTEAAQPVLDRIWTLVGETRAEAMAGLGPAARDQLIASLLTIKQNLLQAEATAPAAAAVEEDQVSHG